MDSINPVWLFINTFSDDISSQQEASTWESYSRMRGIKGQNDNPTAVFASKPLLSFNIPAFPINRQGCE